MASRASLITGRLLMLGSALSFGLMALFTRMLPELPSAEKVFYRSLLGLLIILGLLGISRQQLERPKQIAGLVWRGVFGSLALLCYFYAIDRCGLPKATLYCYTYPIWATFLAWLELGERPSGRAIFCTIIALAGVAITLDFHAKSGGTLSLADFIGILAGLFTGAAIVSVRRLRQSESSWWIVIFFTALGVVFSAPLLVGNYRWPSLFEWLLLLLVAGAAALAQLLMTKAYRVVTASEGSLLSLTVVLWSSLFSVVFLREIPPLRFWFGAALVLASVVWLVASHSSAASEPDEKTPPLVD